MAHLNAHPDEIDCFEPEWNHDKYAVAGLADPQVDFVEFAGECVEVDFLPKLGLVPAGCSEA